MRTRGLEASALCGAQSWTAIDDLEAPASIDLDGAIDASHKRVRCQESDCAHKQTVDQTGQEAVRKEQHR